MNGLLGNAAYYMQRSGQQPGGLLPAGPASFQGGGGGRMLSAPAGVQQSGPSGWGDAISSLAKGVSGAVDAYRASKLKEEANKAVMDIFAGKPVTRTGSVPMMEQTPVSSQISDPSVLAQTVANQQGGSIAAFPLGTSFAQGVTPQDVNLYEETSVPDAREFTVTGRVPYSKDEVRAKILGNPALMELNPKFGMSMLEKMLAPTTYDFMESKGRIFRTSKEDGTVEMAYGKDGEVDAWDADQKEKYVNDLMKQYEDFSQPLLSSRAAVFRMSKAAERGTPASDLSLIYDFFKAKDPGSTVMQGEFENAQDVRGASAYVNALLNKVRTGQKLTPEERQAFIAEAREAYNAFADNFKIGRGQYITRAERIKESGDALFPDYTRENVPEAKLGQEIPTEANTQNIQTAKTKPQMVELFALIENMPDGEEKETYRTMWHNRAMALGLN